MKKVLAMLLALAMVFSLAACGSKNTEETAEPEAAEEAEEAEAEVEEEQADEPAAGFKEEPIFEDEELAFMNVSAVYFQAVPMAPGQENIENYDIHLECDVSALENDLGYEVGSWVPYLTVDFEVTKADDGSEAAAGTFMVMSASDGPHYGANIALPEAGTYNVKFTFHSPAENGYLIHSDESTGPGGLLEDYFGEGNLEVTYEGWEYVPLA